MYRLMALLKGGVAVIAAEAETPEEIMKKSERLETDMMDPTSARIVYRDGTRTVMAKEVAATWVVEEKGDASE